MHHKQILYWFISAASILIIILVIAFSRPDKTSTDGLAGTDSAPQTVQDSSQKPGELNELNSGTSVQAPAASGVKFKAPMPDYLSRVNKKAFGTFVAPGNSPISPEKFRGYHAAIDLEIFSGEEELEVPVKAICDGKLAIKRTAQGYGGLVAQYCVLNGEDVLVLYGHVALTSVQRNIGDEIKTGEKIALLGQPGIDTDNERKHLHLGIRKGFDLVIAGYVPSQSALSTYIDPKTVLIE